MMNSFMSCAGVLILCGVFAASSAHATIINNDIPGGTVEHWAVDVTSGGESRSAQLGADPQGSTEFVSEDVLFDYFTYIDTGSNVFRLEGSTPTSINEDTVRSNGSFTGSNGNNINWTATSSIADGSAVLRNVYEFSVETSGTLGDIRLLQYLDEDVLGTGDDVFFTRGSLADNSLELYTVDDSEIVGVSQSGAFAASQGLANADFAGWSACLFNAMKPEISSGTQSISPSGSIGCGLASFSHSELGTVYGPGDIVSNLAWDVLGDASSATIVTTLGGVPDITEVTPPTPSPSVPAPGSLSLLGLGLVLLGWKLRRVRPSGSALALG